jgi:hypothetical protein
MTLRVIRCAFVSYGRPAGPGTISRQRTPRTAARMRRSRGSGEWLASSGSFEKRGTRNPCGRRVSVICGVRFFAWRRTTRSPPVGTRGCRWTPSTSRAPATTRTAVQRTCTAFEFTANSESAVGAHRAHLRKGFAPLWLLLVADAAKGRNWRSTQVRVTRMRAAARIERGQNQLWTEQEKRFVPRVPPAAKFHRVAACRRASDDDSCPKRIWSQAAARRVP